MSGPDHFAIAVQRIRDQDARIAWLLQERDEQAQRIAELVGQIEVLEDVDASRQEIVRELDAKLAERGAESER